MHTRLEEIGAAILCEMGDRRLLDDVDTDLWGEIGHALASAALLAMRDASKPQLEAAENVIVGLDDFALGDGTIYLYEHNAKDAWRVMVDAILNEAAPSQWATQ